MNSRTPNLRALRLAAQFPCDRRRPRRSGHPGPRRHQGQRLRPRSRRCAPPVLAARRSSLVRRYLRVRRSVHVRRAHVRSPALPKESGRILVMSRLRCRRTMFSCLPTHDLTPVIWTPRARLPALHTRHPPSTVEVDTGMGRQGVAPGEPHLHAILQPDSASRQASILDGRVFTHFCSVRSRRLSAQTALQPATPLSPSAVAATPREPALRARLAARGEQRPQSTIPARPTPTGSTTLAADASAPSTMVPYRACFVRLHACRSKATQRRRVQPEPPNPCLRGKRTVLADTRARTRRNRGLQRHLHGHRAHARCAASPQATRTGCAAN